MINMGYFIYKEGLGQAKSRGSADPPP